MRTINIGLGVIISNAYEHACQVRFTDPLVSPQYTKLPVSTFGQSSDALGSPFFSSLFLYCVSAMDGARVSSGGEGLGRGVKGDHIVVVRLSVCYFGFVS